jgi:hypothetical protein
LGESTKGANVRMRLERSGKNVKFTSNKHDGHVAVGQIAQAMAKC